MTTAAVPRPLRVAIYTRKSVTEGLDQAFNSLDAQRQAIENYVASQVGLGWVLIAKKYDDGGFSGATTERPAFLELLRDVEAGHVDVIAVYKIDRISRSLSDFTRFMEVLDRRGVGFVSITQSFDTRTSMGRLTLNILASFSQFERETIAERIKDKVRETRRRGMWTGGKPPLGFDVIDKRLVVNADEAAQVQAIFRLYLERGSLRDTVAELRRRGWRGKAARKATGGGEFTKVLLHSLLTNPLLRGQIRCGDELVPGAHEAIIDAEVWEAVQQRLRSNARNGGAKAKNKTGSVLRGLVRCGRCGSAMIHTFTTRENRRHRYYYCMRAHNEGAAVCPNARVAAGPFEAYVADQIRTLGRDEAVLVRTTAAVAKVAADRREQIAAEQRRIEQQRCRLPDHDQQYRQLGQRLAELRAEAEAIREIDPEDVRTAVSGFEPVWNELFPAERERILLLLIERITYHPDGARVEIDLRPCGITSLAAEATA